MQILFLFTENKAFLKDTDFYKTQSKYISASICSIGEKNKLHTFVFVFQNIDLFIFWNRGNTEKIKQKTYNLFSHTHLLFLCWNFFSLVFLFEPKLQLLFLAKFHQIWPFHHLIWFHGNLFCRFLARFATFFSNFFFLGEENCLWHFG